jgi:hypothetical protein
LFIHLETLATRWHGVRFNQPESAESDVADQRLQSVISQSEAVSVPDTKGHPSDLTIKCQEMQPERGSDVDFFNDCESHSFPMLIT